MSRLQELRITLTEEQSEAVQAAVASGEYSSPEQIVQATLEDRKWQREWLKPEHLARLQELLRDGKESGDAQRLDWDKLLAEARTRANLTHGRAA